VRASSNATGGDEDESGGCTIDADVLEIPKTQSEKDRFTGVSLPNPSLL
jgi:hypothetical protein